MDLFCPHCQKRVTIPDEKGDQVVPCPLCAGQFRTPKPPSALGTPPAPPPPPSSPPPEVNYSPGLAPSSPPSSQPPPEPKPSEPAAPPPPPGDYSHSYGICFTDNWLPFVPPACLFLIFVLSFFTWHRYENGHTPSMWGLAFTTLGLDDVKQGHILAYTILMLFPTGALVIATVLVNKLPLPPQAAIVKGWLDLVTGLLLGLTFLMLCIDYLDAHFLTTRPNPITLPLKLVFRLHFFAMLASFGMFWLHLRKRRNLPPPRVDCQW